MVTRTPWGYLASLAPGQPSMHATPCRRGPQGHPRADTAASTHAREHSELAKLGRHATHSGRCRVASPTPGRSPALLRAHPLVMQPCPVFRCADPPVAYCFCKVWQVRSTQAFVLECHCGQRPANCSLKLIVIHFAPPFRVGRAVGAKVASHLCISTSVGGSQEPGAGRRGGAGRRASAASTSDLVMPTHIATAVPSPCTSIAGVKCMSDRALTPVGICRFRGLGHNPL